MQWNYVNHVIRAIYTTLQKKITVGNCDRDTFFLKGHKIIFFHQVASFTFMSPMEANSDGKLMTA